MENVSTENKPELADTGSRVVAFLVDTLIQLVFLFIIVLISLFFKIGWLFAAAWVAAFLLPLYYILFETKNGQSPGKKFVDIKVVDREYRDIDFLKAFIRNITKFFPFWPVVGAALIALTEDKQRLGDMLAGTLVIKVKK